MEHESTDTNEQREEDGDRHHRVLTRPHKRPGIARRRHAARELHRSNNDNREQ